MNIKRQPNNKSPVMPPAVGIAGLLAGEECALLYAPILSSPGTSLSLRDRLLFLPDRGKSTMSEILGQLEEKFLQAHERLETRVDLIGHSFGGFAATVLGLKHPDKVASVFCIAGAQEGIRQETVSSRVLKHVLGNPKDAEKLKYESPYMIAHRAEIAARWSENISMHLLASSVDMVLLPPIGLGIELPGNTEPQRRLVVPGAFGLPGLNQLLPFYHGMPANVKTLNAFSEASHPLLVISPGVLRYTRQHRQVAIENSPAAVRYLPMPQISNLPEAA